MAGSLPVLLLLFSSLLWGVTWWPLKAFSAAGVAGAPLILLSYGSLGLVLFALLWRERHVWRGSVHWLVLIGLLGGYANLAFAAAMIYGDVIRAMMLFYLGPVWGVLGARLFLGERIDARRWLGVILAMLGAWVILGADTLLTTASSWIDLLALTAGMALALNNITLRATARFPASAKLVVTFLGCGLFALLWLPFQQGGFPHLSPVLWLALAAFSLIWLLGATLANQWSVARMEAGRASILLITELLVAVLSATLVGGESLAGAEMVGGALIITAAFLEATRSSVSAP